MILAITRTPLTPHNDRLLGPFTGEGLGSRQHLPPTFTPLTLNAGAVVYRIHRITYSPWWFNSDGSQRFDVPQPRPIRPSRGRRGIRRRFRRSDPELLEKAKTEFRFVVW